MLPPSSVDIHYRPLSSIPLHSVLWHVLCLCCVYCVSLCIRYMSSLDLPLNGDNYQVVVLTLHLIFEASLRLIASVGNIKCRVNNVEVIHQCELVGAVMFRNFQNCVCVCAAVVQRSPGPQGATAREAKHVTEERAGETQVTVRTVI